MVGKEHDNLDFDGSFQESPAVYKLDSAQKSEIIETLGQQLKTERDIRFAFLHGSFLEPEGFRDIDIAIYLGEESDREEELNLSIRLSVKLTGKLGLPVDINVLNRATLGFAYHAVQGKILVYRDLEEALQYKEDIIIKYLDFSYHMKANLAELLR